MAATALLKFSQAGVGSPPGGQSLKADATDPDPVVIENTVNTDVASWRIELLYGPPGTLFERDPGDPDVLAEHPNDPTPTHNLTLASGVDGECYRIRLRVWDGPNYTGSMDEDIRCFGVPRGALEAIFPPNQIDPLPLVNKPNELNFGDQPFHWSGHNYATSGVRLVNATLAALVDGNDAASDHFADTDNPHGTDLGNIGDGTLAELNDAITDATLDDASDPRTPTAHGLGSAYHTSATLAQLNALVSDATLDDSGDPRPPNGDAGGDLDGTYPDPEVIAIRSNGVGTTRLPILAVDEWEFLQRQGASIVGSNSFWNTKGFGYESEGNDVAGGGVTNVRFQLGNMRRVQVTASGVTLNLQTSSLGPVGSVYTIRISATAYPVTWTASVGSIVWVHGAPVLSVTGTTFVHFYFTGSAWYGWWENDLARVDDHASDHESGGADEIDGDQLDIDWNPSNYTPSTAPGEVDSVDQLTAHLYGIDQALGSGAFPGFYTGLPANVDAGTGAVGTGTQCVRNDHKHHVNTGNPDTLDFSGAGDPGTSSNLARADHKHAVAIQVTPTACTAAAGSGGSLDTLVRGDHRHQITTGVTPHTLGLGDIGDEGASAALARADHVHGYPPYTGATTTIGAGAATNGTATEPARGNHTHTVETASGVSALTQNTAGSAGSSTALAHADHIHSCATQSAMTACDAGAGSGGSASTFVRGDHKHQIATSVPPVSIEIGDGQLEGTSNSLARADHQHALTAYATVPADVNANAATGGSATAPARGDHTHQVQTSTAVPVQVGLTGTAGTSQELARANHQHGINLSSTTFWPLDIPEISDPGNPSTGRFFLWADSTTHRVHLRNHDGDTWDLTSAGS